MNCYLLIYALLDEIQDGDKGQMTDNRWQMTLLRLREFGGQAEDRCS